MRRKIDPRETEIQVQAFSKAWVYPTAEWDNDWFFDFLHNFFNFYEGGSR